MISTTPIEGSIITSSRNSVAQVPSDSDKASSISSKELSFSSENHFQAFSEQWL